MFSKILKDDFIIQLIKNPLEVNKYYRIFNIYKNNKPRRIEEPLEPILSIQKELVEVIYNNFQFHSACSALKNKSILNNASPHFNKKLILKVDISKFYQHITINKIIPNIQKYAPQWKNYIEILFIATIQKGAIRILPTGAPTSPILCNIAATNIDYQLQNLASELKANYTRYIDDISFSFDNDIDNLECNNIFNRINNIIINNNYYLNYKKTEWIKPNTNKAYNITGVNLDTNKSKISRRQRRICRARVFQAAKNHQELDDITRGYLSYIKMLDTNSYNKLLQYYENQKAAISDTTTHM